MQEHASQKAMPNRTHAHHYPIWEVKHHIPKSSAEESMLTGRTVVRANENRQKFRKMGLEFIVEIRMTSWPPRTKALEQVSNKTENYLNGI